MKNEFEELLESGLLDEETSSAVKTAVTNKIAQAVEIEKENLREEYARRYEHDKSVMTEAADNMFNSVLEEEVAKLGKARKALGETKIALRKKAAKNTRDVNNFITAKLVTEIKELQEDRKGFSQALVKFENFAVKKLTEELIEFHQDKKDLVDTKVKLVKEAKGKIASTKREFIRRASRIVEDKIDSTMRKELSVLRKDIKEAKKNMFGRKIFEAMESEFLVSHASDGTKLKEMANAIKERESMINNYSSKLSKLENMNNSLTKAKKIAENKLVRQRKLNSLLGHLPTTKRELMGDLLENVRTDKLDESFKKHIKSVMREYNKFPNPNNSSGELIQESIELTGNRKNVFHKDMMDNEEKDRFRRLAGITGSI